MRQYALVAVGLLFVKSALSYVVTRVLVYVFRIESEEAQTIICKSSYPGLPLRCLLEG